MMWDIVLTKSLKVNPDYIALIETVVRMHFVGSSPNWRLEKNLTLQGRPCFDLTSFQTQK